VKNTGSRDLQVSAFVVLVDGKASADWDATVEGSAASSLKPGQLATITVNDLAVASGDHRAVVVADSGYAATLDFAV
jgi:archaellum component FlaG (FlaF/FlaG flagellin family)